MKRQIGIVIGIGALVTTSTSIAIAYPVPQDANQGIQKRAGGSLSNIENRSVSKDFEYFFPEVSRTTTVNYPEGINKRRSQAQTEVPLIDDIRIEIGDNSPNESFDIFPNPRNGDRSDDSQILYEFEEW